MQADGQVIFQIEGDNKGLKTTLQDTTSAIQSESKKWDNAASSSSQGMQASFTGALKTMAGALAASKIGSMLADFGKQAINAASDLEEVQNVVDVTFGESANEINAWAKNAINQFGLTETQAKRFASTMGAMMKSSGIASKDITEMSENLAGLAADMVSFYNLDFDEAFNKIRSGISGETEPLKALGINMSVANLEAFALSQGLKKTFNEMSQGEQVMLRYQYLMQATSDAQGDFARTSDGFANGLRLLQSNFEQLKTTIGSLLLPIVSQAISGLNDMLGLLIPDTKETTVLDDFANINLQTEQKLNAIRETKEKADELVKILEDIQNAKIVDKATDLETVASGANTLNDNTGTNWKSFVSALDGIGDVITSSSGGANAGRELKGLADGGKELTGTPVTDFKYENLPAKIQALYDKAVGADAAKNQLETIDESAGTLTKDKQTDFKYDDLSGDLATLESATSTAATDIPEEVKKLDAGMEDITTDQTTGFKFSKYEGDIAGLETKTGDAAKGVETEVGNLDSAMKDITTDDNTTGFKFSKYEKDADGLVTKTGEAATGVAEEVGNIDSAMKDITTDNNNTGFKFGKYETDVEGLVTKTGEAAKGVETEIGNIDKATADITTAQDTDFKYDDLKSDVTTLNSEMKTAASDLPNNVGKVNKAVEAITGKIRILDSTSRNNWISVLSVFKKIPGYTDAIDSKKIWNIADAFAKLDGDKAGAWETLMDALGSDLTALSALTGKDEKGAAAWLEEMKNAANGLNSDDVNAWNTLFSLLVNDAEGAGNFMGFEDIAKLAQSLGLADTMLVQVGDKTMTVSEATDMYKESMKRLVQLYPELNDLINSETGEIKGSTEEIYKRIDAITKQHEKEVLLYGLQQKRMALEKKFAELPALRVDAAMAQNAVRAMQADYDKALERLKEIGAYQDQMGNWVVDDLSKQEEVINLVENVIDKYEALVDASEAATNAYEEQQNAYSDASKQYDELEQSIEGVTEAQEEGKRAAKEYTDEQKKAATDGVKALTDALKDVNDYIERTKKSTEDSIDSSLKGFKDFKLGATYIQDLKTQAGNEAARIQTEINKALEDKKGTIELEMKLAGVENNIPTLEKMQKALEDQAAFLKEYNDNLKIAKDYGLSDDFLEQFADFSQENAVSLHLIKEGGKDAALGLQAAFDSMKKEKKPLVDTFTELKLKADESFNEMVNKAKEAAIQLNNGDIAKESMASTVEGIAQGIQAAVPEVKEAVDALNAELSRLGDFGSNYNVFGDLSGTGINISFGNPDKLAVGMDYVPFDNYLAYLHEGESVLTAEEAAMWRNFKSGGSNLRNTIDYGQLSGAIWDNAPNMGGNVYLDGRTVGKVISAQQANSYRQLERSGWQG